MGVKSVSSKSLGASPRRETLLEDVALTLHLQCLPTVLPRTCTSSVSANTVGLSRVCKEPFSVSSIDLRDSQRFFLLCTAYIGKCYLHR